MAWSEVYSISSIHSYNDWVTSGHLFHPWVPIDHGIRQCSYFHEQRIPRFLPSDRHCTEILSSRWPGYKQFGRKICPDYQVTLDEEYGRPTITISLARLVRKILFSYRTTLLQCGKSLAESCLNRKLRYSTGRSENIKHIEDIAPFLPYGERVLNHTTQGWKREVISTDFNSNPAAPSLTQTSTVNHLRRHCLLNHLFQDNP
jgi:hypothetical protein